MSTSAFVLNLVYFVSSYKIRSLNESEFCSIFTTSAHSDRSTIDRAPCPALLVLDPRSLPNTGRRHLRQTQARPQLCTTTDSRSTRPNLVVPAGVDEVQSSLSRVVPRALVLLPSPRHLCDACYTCYTCIAIRLATSHLDARLASQPADRLPNLPDDLEH